MVQYKDSRRDEKRGNRIRQRKMMQGNRGTGGESEENGGNSKTVERRGYGEWEANNREGINGERYDEWYYGIRCEEDKNENCRTVKTRYQQKKMSMYQMRMAQQAAIYGTEVQQFMKGEKAGKSWEDIFENESGKSENQGWKKEHQ